MWRKETSSDGLGDEIVGAECSVLRSGLPVGMFMFSRRSLFKLRCQPTPCAMHFNGLWIFRLKKPCKANRMLWQSP